MKQCLIAPSILAADFANLQSEVEKVNGSAADFLHIDIMDGVFVPNISFGFPVAEAIHRHSKKDLDFHLMIIDPDPYLRTCVDCGAKNITVHYETCNHLHRTVQAIKNLGCRAGVALNPHTPVHVLEDILAEVDLALLMSVNPGFGGQTFIPNTYRKIEHLRQMADRLNPELLIEVDGGVNTQNAAELKQKGANVLVAGNEVFKSKNPADTILTLKNV